MRNNHYSLALKWIILVIALLTPILLINNVATAASGQNIRSARWIFDLSFQNGQIQARRINQLYLDHNLTNQWSQPVTCKKSGAITIVGNYAFLDGGYLTCYLPDFQQEVANYTQGLVQLRDECLISGNRFDVWAQARIGTINFNKASDHPILSHPDYEINYAAEQDGVNAVVVLDAGDASQESSPFIPTGLGDLLGSRIFDCNNQFCTARHLLNNVITDNDTIPQVAPIEATTQATTLYVGKEDNLRFYGNLSSVRSDPGCIATTN